MKYAPPEIRLERVVDALSDELAQTTDVDVVEAADDLRMNLTMRGSAAFLGLKGLFLPYRQEKFRDVGEPVNRGHSKRLPESPEKS